MHREDGCPITTVGHDRGGGRAEGGEKFLLAVIPAVIGGDPSEQKSRWIPATSTRE
jgi:hypothetical protein